MYLTEDVWGVCNPFLHFLPPSLDMRLSHSSAQLFQTSLCCGCNGDLVLLACLLYIRNGFSGYRREKKVATSDDAYFRGGIVCDEWPALWFCQWPHSFHKGRRVPIQLPLSSSSFPLVYWEEAIVLCLGEGGSSSSSFWPLARPKKTPPGAAGHIWTPGQANRHAPARAALPDSPLSSKRTREREKSMWYHSSAAII